MDINQSFQKYLSDISLKYSHFETSEMGYRTDFETLLKLIFLDLHIHHDAKTLKGNKPDFIIYKDVPLLYIEVKDIGVSLDKIEKSDQMARYYGYANLILTDYVEFRFYRNGIKYQESIKIAEYDKLKRTLRFNPSQFNFLSKTMIDFAKSHKEPIKSGLHLAKILGGRASRIRDNVKEMLTKPGNNSDLQKIFEVVKTSLLSDLTVEKFADMYAQTLVYGLFVARYYDNTLENFSRQEARELLPATNPFLRAFFDHIAGSNFPERLKFIVDELCEIFTHSNISDLLHNSYGYEKENRDPIIHFYEDFLREYDSKIKMEMGVFYTPKEVVQFIVRSVDEILKTEFGLSKGLADSSKVTRKVYEKDGKGRDVKVDKEFHRVQILDIATGTGSFLNETILQIYKSFENNKGSWESYVKEHLIPRLHGFELMMASYTIAHLKLGMTLGETGVKELSNRLGVYLTNTLEEGVDNQLQGTLFGLMESIADEAREASRVKNELPIMVVIGNPPYSGESMNAQYKGNDVYKVEPGGKQKLQEKNSKWINDDYVKFIRFSESLVEKNQVGVIGIITAHGYIDNPTFRGMRWHLRRTFDKIYVIDLHGNANKREVALDGSKDENIFDIKTGVAIIFGIKTGSKSQDQLGELLKFDLQGLRSIKFKTLNSNSLETLDWKVIPKENDLWKIGGKDRNEYDLSFKVNELLTLNNVGVVTANDSVLIDNSREELLTKVQENYKEIPDTKYIKQIAYRPFDNRFIYYDVKKVERAREAVMQHFLKGENIGLNWIRPMSSNYNFSIFISKYITDQCSAGNKSAGAGISYLAPLYIYNEDGSKIPNFNHEIYSKISKVVGEVTPENILDYIYVVLYTPSYREKYKEFLKIDFPRVPYPQDRESFLTLAEKGKMLRKLHLMESSDLETLMTTSFNISGNNIVEKLKFENNKVYINAEQYFDNVSDIAWNFYIGGYQPAQKWLKDRKSKTLGYEDIEHYREIIAILDETDKIMKTLDKVYVT